jgi:hypothetical protein
MEGRCEGVRCQEGWCDVCCSHNSPREGRGSLLTEQRMVVGVWVVRACVSWRSDAVREP